jgi:hypothetical protein
MSQHYYQLQWLRSGDDADSSLLLIWFLKKKIFLKETQHETSKCCNNPGEQSETNHNDNTLP